MTILNFADAIFILLVGFGHGYSARAIISRRRHARRRSHFGL
jgi:hypothetical protein